MGDEPPRKVRRVGSRHTSATGSPRRSGRQHAESAPRPEITVDTGSEGQPQHGQVAAASQPTPSVEQHLGADHGHMHLSEGLRGTGDQFDRSHSRSGSNVSSPGAIFEGIDVPKDRCLPTPGEDDHLTLTNNYATNEKLLSEFTHCSDSGLDLEGKHIVSIANEVEQGSIDYSAVACEDLLSKVRGDLEPPLKFRSAFSKTDAYFLPWTKLHKVLSKTTVLRLLQHLSKAQPETSRLAPEELPQLADKMAPPLNSLFNRESLNGQFRRTFATLLLVGREIMIFDFVNLNLNDGKLLTVSFDEESRSESLLFSKWSTREIKDFMRYRWHLSPTFFSVKWDAQHRAGDAADSYASTYHKLVRYRLRSQDEVLPFLDVNMPEDSTGGFGVVGFYLLHEDQQDLPRYTRRGKFNPIAVKTLKNDSKGSKEQRSAFVNEAYFILRLQSQEHTPHLAKLLATIEVPGRISQHDRTEYHLMFEAAKRTVLKLWQDESWWRDRTTGGVAGLRLTKWAALQCYGLAHAISKFHDFQKAEHDKNPKTRGLHCDIKPDNILHYDDWVIDENSCPQGTVDDELGVLQLNDFGLSSFHSTATVDDKRIHGAFLDYAAPETDFLLTHTRASDVWHLGCLFMDFATWLLDGPEGYRKFSNERLTDSLRGKRCRFATFTKGSQFKHARRDSDLSETGKNRDQSQTDDRTFVEVNRRVLAQATYLCEHENSSQFVRELCHLAVNYLLVMRDTNQTQKRVQYCEDLSLGGVEDRLTSTQVAEILGERSAKGDDYFLPSPCGDFLGFEDKAWKRSFLELNYGVQQLRNISWKVRSGLDPRDAGLKEPGVARRPEVE